MLSDLSLLCVEILETAEILTFWPTDSIWVMICLEMTISSCKMFYNPLSSSWVWVSVFNSVVEIWELRNVVRDDFDIFHTYCLLTNSNYLLPSAKSQLVHWFLMRILFMKYLCSFLQNIEGKNVQIKFYPASSKNWLWFSLVENQMVKICETSQANLFVKNNLNSIVA